MVFWCVIYPVWRQDMGFLVCVFVRMCACVNASVRACVWCLCIHVCTLVCVCVFLHVYNTFVSVFMHQLISMDANSSWASANGPPFKTRTRSILSFSLDACAAEKEEAASCLCLSQSDRCHYLHPPKMHIHTLYCVPNGTLFPSGPWSKGVNYKGNRMPSGTPSFKYLMFHF